MYLSLPINRPRGRLFCHAKPFGNKREKSVAENADFFFISHALLQHNSGIPYNLSKNDANIFIPEICKKGSNRVVVFQK